MQYKNISTGEIVNAYKIAEVIFKNTYYEIYCPEYNATHGLYPDQTEHYIPQKDDFYIDRGDIRDSSIMSKKDFLDTHALADE